MDGQDCPSYRNGHHATVKAVCRSQPIIIIRKQSSKLVANTRGSHPYIQCDGATNQAGVERGPSEQREGNCPSLSSGSNNHGAGQVDPIPKEMVCDHGRNHETINLVATEGKSSLETSSSGHNSHENQGTVTMRNSNYDITVCTGNQGTGTNTGAAPESSGNGKPVYYDKPASRGHEGTVHMANILPTSKTLTVTHPVLHHYSLEYLWSPMLKYCQREEVYCGHICSGEASH